MSIVSENPDSTVHVLRMVLLYFETCFLLCGLVLVQNRPQKRVLREKLTLEQSGTNLGRSTASHEQAKHHLPESVRIEGTNDMIWPF